MNSADNGDIEIGVATERDLDGVLQLQDANQTSRGGTLSASFSRSRIISMMGDMPQVVARRGGRVIGFLMSSATESVDDIPIVRAMLDAYPSRTKEAYVYGPICVESTERGKGVAQAMFAKLAQLLPGREGILFIRSDNAASMRSHGKMGMREVSAFSFQGVMHMVLSYIA